MIVVVDGNVGSSKRSILATLKNAGYTVCLVPTHAWKQLQYSGTVDVDWLTCVILLWFIVLGKKHSASRSRVAIERCPNTVMCMYGLDIIKCKDKKLKNVQQRLWAQVHEFFTPKAYVFITDTPSQCMKRLKTKQETEGIRNILQLDYLKQLDNYMWALAAQLHLDGNVVVCM